jgi:hypothetical protein
VVIIEMLGPPGAGKSTVRQYLIRKLLENSLQMKDERDLEKEIMLNRYGLDCSSSWLNSYIGKLKLYSSIYTGSTYLRSVMNNALLSVQRPGRLGLYWFAKDICISSYYQHTGAAQGYHYFSNEGLLQHLVSLRVFANKDMNDLYKVMVDSIDMNDIAVIRIMIDPEAGLQRLNKRGIPDTWPFYRRTASRVKLYNDRYHNRIDELVNQLKDHGMKVYEIGVGGEWDEVKTKVDICSKSLVSELGSQSK